jgi:hypothetical protein
MIITVDPGQVVGSGASFVFLRRSAALLVATALLLSASEALADDDAGERAHNFLAVGGLIGFTGHLDAPVLGALGATLSYTSYPWDPYFIGVGAFAEVESVGFKHVRAALGGQLNVMIAGLEVGASIEQGGDGKATTFGAQLSPFVSIGIVSVAFRIGIPIAALVEGDRYATDLGLVATTKIPIPLDGTF